MPLGLLIESWLGYILSAGRVNETSAALEGIKKSLKFGRKAVFFTLIQFKPFQKQKAEDFHLTSL